MRNKAREMLGHGEHMEQRAFIQLTSTSSCALDHGPVPGSGLGWAYE